MRTIEIVAVEVTGSVLVVNAFVLDVITIFVVDDSEVVVALIVVVVAAVAATVVLLTSTWYGNVKLSGSKKQWSLLFSYLHPSIALHFSSEVLPGLMSCS